MKTKSRAKSRIFEAVHETASDLHRLGFIDKRKMRKFDALCLDPIPQYDGEKIRSLRAHLQVSQAVLAAVLNTSLSTVRKWDVGDKCYVALSLRNKSREYPEFSRGDCRNAA